MRSEISGLPKESTVFIETGTGLRRAASFGELILALRGGPGLGNHHKS